MVLSRLKAGLEKTRNNLVGQLERVFGRGPALNEALWEKVEEILLSADLGVKATLRIVERLKEEVQKQEIRDSEDLFRLLEKELLQIFSPPAPGDRFQICPQGQEIIIVVGVNGTGKTTTIAKIAHHFKTAGQKVLLVAADTFRAAAIEQLEFWANRVGIDLIKHQPRSDPAAVVYDAVHAADSRRIDLVLIDTAGRLHTYVNLMEELKKVKRIALREARDARVETLLIIDATTGQNGLAQAKLFHEALQVDGIALTKLDGTAKGGIVVAIAEELGIPIKWIGLGEGMDDLQEFSPSEFVKALLFSKE